MCGRALSTRRIASFHSDSSVRVLAKHCMMRTVFAGYSYLGFIAESAENLIRKINRNFAVAMNVGFRRDVLRLLVA
jgi:hypothetical protein